MFWCETGKHVPEYVIVSVYNDPDGIGVLVGGEGDVTNRWADGVAGVDNETWEAADGESEGTCTEHGALAFWSEFCDLVNGPCSPS